jgi:hypothetical protein
MRVVTASPTLGGMFKRTSKSSSAAAPPKLSSRAGVDDRAETRGDHIREWRDAAKQVVSAYNAWSAADSCDRPELYVSFVDALGREERAAQQVERGAPAPAAARPR